MKLEDIRIHCIGDSHVSVFTGKDTISKGWPCPQDSIQYFHTYWLGPVLAYNLYSVGHQSRLNLFNVLESISKSDYVMLCAGEIDCRMHLIRQKELQNKSLEEIVQECVCRYFQVILEIKNMGFKVIIWGVPGTANIDCFELKDKNTFPHYGTYKERNQATKIFNNKIEYLCKLNDVLFLSIFDDLIDDNGKTKITEYYMDEFHVSQKVMPLIISKLKNVLNKE
jgi:hypothetical protein